MTFDRNLFVEYKRIMDNTMIRSCYRQVMSLIKTIASVLEERLPAYRFMKRIVENQMDVTYFQLTNEQLKDRGLKIQVAFVHETCEFEVWMSGYNRNIQCAYAKVLAHQVHPFLVSTDPARDDYIVKAVIKNRMTDADAESIVSEMQLKIEHLSEYFLDLSAQIH